MAYRFSTLEKQEIRNDPLLNPHLWGTIVGTHHIIKAIQKETNVKKIQKYINHLSGNAKHLSNEHKAIITKAAKNRTTDVLVQRYRPNLRTTINPKNQGNTGIQFNISTKYKPRNWNPWMPKNMSEMNKSWYKTVMNKGYHQAWLNTTNNVLGKRLPKRIHGKEYYPNERTIQLALKTKRPSNKNSGYYEYYKELLKTR